ncbi:hypothetical protein EG831_07275, partial [bacterium]|nr:hypothetical protein [bacterium]
MTDMETTMNRTYRVAIEGMHCHACERLVTANLSEVPGITVLSADAKAGTALIQSTNGEPDTASIARAIEAAGFKPAGGTVTLEPAEATVSEADEPTPVAEAAPVAESGADEPCPTGTCPTVPPAPDESLMAASAAAATSSATLGIIGMTCSSCQAVIERTLQRTPGVGSAVVNLANETASVSFDPHTIGIEGLVQAVRNAGYDAVPRLETAAEGGDDAQRVAQQAHIRKEWRLFTFSLVLSIPLVLLMIPALMESVPLAVATWLAQTFGGAWDPMMVFKYIGFALATPVQFIAGWQFYKGFFHALKRRTGNMDTLIAIGTSSAYFYSLAATFIPALYMEPVFYETAALLITFVILGKLLEARAKGKTSDAIKKLMGLAAKTARVLR